MRLRPKKKGGKLTDGVGIIDLAWSRWLSTALCGEKDGVHTFQIRLPFVKGMVHSVDFRSYLKDRGVEKIKDAWGTERDVNKLRMIIPLSMFKAYGWFGNDAQSIAKYFQAFKEYGHDLFITQRHLSYRRTEPYLLNYGVLQTCGLTEKNFVALVNQNLDMYRKLRTDEQTRIQYFTGNDSETEDETNYLISKAIAVQPRLVHSKKAKEILTKACDAMAMNILWGQLALGKDSHGESRYLTCDLGRYLDYLVTLDAKKEKSNLCKKFTPLSPGEFYAPGFSAKGKYCAIFRMPHYSRNEHLVLQPQKDEERDRYFGHLNGVVMLPAEGFGPQRLGGADFDGDHVTIIDDYNFVSGLERALGLSEKEGEERNKLGGSGLPFIDIPSDSTGTSLYKWVENKENGTDNREEFAAMEFRSFHAGCINRVGLFSNYAFSHSSAAYGPEASQESQRMVQRFTALTGLEIDSVKTGRKPVVSSDADIKNGVFLTIKQDSKKAIKEGMDFKWEKPSSGDHQGAENAATRKYFALDEELKKAEDAIALSVKNSNEEPDKAKSVKRAVPCALDQIPSRLLKTYRSLKDSRCPTTKLSDVFQFPGVSINKKLCEQLKILSAAYYDVLYYKPNQRKKPNIPTIDYDLSRILGCRCSRRADYENLCLQCVRFFRGISYKDNRQKLRDELVQHKFELAETPEKRDQILLSALQSSKISYNSDDYASLRKQFTDFTMQGFTLPYIMLRMADELENRGKKREQVENPYRKDLASCSRDELLAKTRTEARKLCRKCFSNRDHDGITRILAAHLLANGAESFFWDMLGNRALDYLGEDEKCHD